MTSNPTKKQRTTEQIQETILTDFLDIMNTPDSITGKFILIAVGIEFLGAHLDRQHMNATARSERRFNSAILKLFPKKYHHYVKPGSVPNLYLDFRCPVIHQFKAGRGLFLTNRQDSLANNFRHLSIHPNGALILVAEEFYKDLAEAGNALTSSL